MPLAHLNWGILRGDWDSAEVSGFVAGLETVNALAERTPGFLWRLTDDAMEAEQLDPSGVFGGNPRLASTLSLWRDVESLAVFTYQTLHGSFLRRRAEWFLAEANDGPRYVLWTLPEGALPTMADGAARRALLERLGPTEDAFDFGFCGVGLQKPAPG